MSVSETIEQQKHDRVLSRASSRKELAATVHDLLIPELQRLAGNDRVTQDVCKAVIAGLKAQGEAVGQLSQRLMAIETMSFGARLRWAFTFSPKQVMDGTGSPASDREPAADTAAAPSA